MSAQCQADRLRAFRTGTRELKQIFLFKLLEDASFDFDELIRNEQGEQSVRVGVDGDIQCHQLIE